MGLTIALVHRVLIQLSYSYDQLKEIPIAVNAQFGIDTCTLCKCTKSQLQGLRRTFYIETFKMFSQSAFVCLHTMRKCPRSYTLAPTSVQTQNASVGIVCGPKKKNKTKQNKQTKNKQTNKTYKQTNKCYMTIKF